MVIVVNKATQLTEESPSEAHYQLDQCSPKISLL